MKRHKELIRWVGWLMRDEFPRRAKRPRPNTIRSHALIGNLVRVCPGGRHGWFETNVGIVRKPL